MTAKQKIDWEIVSQKLTASKNAGGSDARFASVLLVEAEKNWGGSLESAFAEAREGNIWSAVPPQKLAAFAARIEAAATRLLTPEEIAADEAERIARAKAVAAYDAARALEKAAAESAKVVATLPMPVQQILVARIGGKLAFNSGIDNNNPLEGSVRVMQFSEARPTHSAYGPSDYMASFWFEWVPARIVTEQDVQSATELVAALNRLPQEQREHAFTLPGKAVFQRKQQARWPHSPAHAEPHAEEVAKLLAEIEQLAAAAPAPIEYVNLTPHVVRHNDGREWAPSGAVARVEQTFEPTGDPDLIICGWGQAVGLPPQQENVRLIVSAMVLAASDRTDLVAPATGHPKTVRKDGQIWSVPGFLRK